MAGNQFVMPGVSRGDGYLPPPTGVLPDENALYETFADVRASLDEQAEREAGAPPDPTLINLRVQIRDVVKAFADRDAQLVKAHYDDPTRSRYKPEGLSQLDQEFETARANERAALKAKLDQQLDVVEDSVHERIEQSNGLQVGSDDDAAALRFVKLIAFATPSNRAGVIADFMKEAAQAPALAYSVLPLLRSLIERGGGSLYGNDYELAKAAEVLNQIVEARPGIARAGADLRLVEETRRQLGFLADASASVVVPRWIGSDFAGNEKPVTGHAGMSLEFSGSETARQMFGDGPALDDKPVAPPRPRSGFPDRPEWDTERGFRRMNPGSQSTEGE